MPKVTQPVRSQSWDLPCMGQVPWASDQRHLGTLMGTTKHTKAQGGGVTELVLGRGEMAGSDTAPLSLRLKTRSQGWRERTQLGGETRGLQARVQDQTCQLRGKAYSQSGPPPLLTAACGLGP